MIAWLQNLSPIALAIVCSGSFVLLTWFGIVFVRPFLRLVLRRQAGANDLVAYTALGSLLYGLLLGLLSVATYQNAAQVQTSVQREEHAGAAVPGQHGVPRAVALGTAISTSRLHALRRPQGLAGAP